MQSENEPQLEDEQQRRPPRRSRALQELQIYPPPEGQTRRQGHKEPRFIVNEPPIQNDPPQEEEAQQTRPRRRQVAQEEPQVQPPLD